jgi:hypothetical protein
MVIPSQFSNARDFCGGLAPFEANKKWGYVDKTGKIIIEHQFNDAYSFTYVE